MAVDIGKGVLHITPDLSTFQADLRRVQPMLTAGLGATAAGAALTFGLTKPLIDLGKTAVQTAISFEDALAGVAKTIGNVTDIADPLVVGLGQELRELAKNSPIAVEEFARIGEIAGQLGVPAENIAGFAKVVAELAATTDLTIENAAFSLAQFAVVVGDSTSMVEDYSNVIVDLGNKFATTEPQILSMASRIAGAGSTVGLASTEIFALANALAQVGVRAELGGTAISRVIVEIASSVAGGGEKLKIFADVAGLTVEKFTELQYSDPAQALLAFITGLGRVKDEGAAVFKVLEDLDFGNVRVRDVLLRSAGAAEEYARSLQVADQAVEDGTARQIEFDKRMQTTVSHLARARNIMRDAFITLGDDALPVVKAFADGSAQLVEGLTRLPGPIKSVLGMVTLLAGAIGPLLLTYGGFLQTVAVMKLLKAQHKDAATAATAQATAVEGLATAYGHVATNAAAAGAAGAAGGVAGAAGRGAAGIGLTEIGIGGAALASMRSVRSSATSGAISRFGRVFGGQVSRGLKPSFSSIGKGLGIGFGLSIVNGLVQSVETEANTGGRQVQNVLSGALSGASVGALVGSIFPGIGTAIGGGLGALTGAAIGAFADTADSQEVTADLYGKALEQAAEDAQPTAIESGASLAQAVADGVSQSDAIDEAFEDFAKEMFNQMNDFEALFDSAEDQMPNIFASLFDEERLNELLNGIPAEFNEAGEKVKEAVAAWDWEQIEELIRGDMDLLSELDDTIDTLRGLGLSGLAEQIAEKGGPEAIAAGRIIRDQLKNDPDSVFNLEADILGLSGDLKEAFVNLLSSGDIADINSQLETKFRGVGVFDAERAMREGIPLPTGTPVSDFIDDIVQNEPDLAKRFATALQGPLAEGANLALRGEFIEQEFNPNLETLLPVIEEAIKDLELRDSVNTAINDIFAGGGGIPVDIPIFINGKNVGTQTITATNTTELMEALQTATNNIVGAEGGVAVSLSDLLGVELDPETLNFEIAGKITEWLNSDEFNNALRGRLPEGDVTQGQLQETVLQLIEEQIGGITAEVIAGRISPLEVEVPVAPSIVGLTSGYGTTPGQTILDGFLLPDQGKKDVQNDVADLALSLPAIAREKLRAESPSQEFVDISKDIIAGMRLGLNGDVFSAFMARLDSMIQAVRAKGEAMGQAFIQGVNAGLRGIDVPDVPEPPERRGRFNPQGAGGDSYNFQFEINHPHSDSIVEDTRRSIGVAKTARFGTPNGRIT